VKPRIVAGAALTALSIVFFALEVFAWPTSARLGVSATFNGACTMRVSAASAANGAAGIRVGDTINLRDTDYLSRLVLVMQNDSPSLVGRTGDKIVLAVQRGNQELKIPATLRRRDPLETFVSGLVFKLFFLILGIFVLWRGRDLASLFLGIWTLGLLIPLPVAWWGAWGNGGRLAASAVSALLWTYSPIPLYFIIESLSRRVLPRAVVVAARWLIFATMLPSIFEVVVNALARVTSGCVVLPMRGLNDFMFVATQVVMVTFFILAYVAARGEQRRRVHWVFWSFIISRFGVFANLLGRVIGHPLHLYEIEWLTVMVFPIGCGYAILRHKLMDVNTVLNRAIVYTLLTTVVVGIFLALEALFQHFEVARGLSLIVELALAVAIGLSMNTVHQRVESAIERLLFGRKHRAEAKLAALAEEASFIESPQALLRRTVTDVAASLRAGDVGIYERGDGVYRLTCASEGSRLPESADADDSAFIRLRKSLAEVEMGGLGSQLGTQGYAFPLSVRGRMFGALVCGRREEDEGYAPDERALLRNVAREVAAELYLIRSRDLSELARAIAAGRMTPDEARERARELTITSE